MRQASFGFTSPNRKTNTMKADVYDAANLRSAQVILADPQRFGGPEAFPVIWSRTVLARLNAIVTAPDFCEGSFQR